MTVKGPKGRMTKPLATKYDVGDVVKLVNEQGWLNKVGTNGLHAPSVGEVGTIRRVIISAPNDGDDTFLMFYVKFPTWGATTILHESEFVLVAKNETRQSGEIAPADAEWLRRQLDGLNEKHA